MGTKKKVAKKKGRQAGSNLRSFVFIGDPSCDGHGPASTNACGYIFEKNGKPVSVSADAARRISGNTHFTEK